MCSIEQELNEIEQDWEIEYLEEAGNEKYIVKLTCEEASLLVGIPDDYPDSVVKVDFVEEKTKNITEAMQQNILRSCQRNLTTKIGKPMLKSTLNELLKELKIETENKKVIENDSPSNRTVVTEPKLRQRKGARMAACFSLQNDADHLLKSPRKKSTKYDELDDKVQSMAKIDPRKNHKKDKPHGKAASMKTARDVINRFKWDDQLKDEEFIIGYEDRFCGIIEIPWSDLNWQDDIAATGPADKLAIPEHRVQYFKWNSKIVWDKETRTDFVFGSTGSKIDILEFIKKNRQDEITESESNLNLNESNTSVYVEEMARDIIEKCLTQVENLLASEKEDIDTTSTNEDDCSGTSDQLPKKQRQRNRNNDLRKKHWETNISKKLTGILRHNNMGFEIDEEGFVEVNTILAHGYFKNQSVTEDDIVKIVEKNDKQRFLLVGEESQRKIRANQGHSVTVESLDMQEIDDPTIFPTAVHGTKFKLWKSISETGLNRMKRNHIHLATGEIGNKETISGMRNSSDCFIYIDLEKAMADGIKFFISDNGVILTEGKDGVLHSKYFKEVYRRRKKGKRELIYQGSLTILEEHG